MSKNLVIVESPTKAKTISRFLGKDYTVLASMGHVRDLPKSKMGIDIKNDFEPTYMIPLDKKKIITQLKGELKKADTLWIATDEDREGEAIGWHLLEALEVAKKKIPMHRIAFHEITERAIKDAITHPREIDEDLVNAQQARRVLDRLVGYELSPLLWKKIRYGLSAGRVQSVAVRLVVEREREILAFKPEEYWSITGLFENDDKKEFSAELKFHKDSSLKISNEAESKKILEAIENADYKVKNIEQKEVHRSPAPPFTTSTLQQEASRKLGFAVKKTMMIAQQLYEGIDIGKGEVGLITYMRTDSVNLSQIALAQAKEIIKEQFGDRYALPSPRYYKSGKGAQQAHEAIRPTDLSIRPNDVKKYLSKDQHRLYELIWKRTIACQMAEAIMDRVAVDIEGHKNGKSTDYIFRANGQTIKFAGFIEAYMEGRDLPEEESEDKEKLLPKLSVGENLDLKNINPEQHFTKPPARYTEASLVKKLESEGIGRPSTYAPTISTILARGYVEKEAKALKPTDTGMVVTDMLVEHFPNIVDYKFTAEMEEKLDKVEEGDKGWVAMIRNFYEPFHKIIAEKDKTLKRSDIINETTDEICDQCGSKMVIKLGRFGKFLSCSNYPTCKNAKPLEEPEVEENPQVKKEIEALAEKFKDKKCEKCGKPVEVKNGRFGPYFNCTNPDCKHMASIVVFSGVKCVKCATGQLIERRTRKAGKIFWGCNKFPRCHFATWNKPVDVCKKCGGLRVELKTGEIKCMECEMEKKPSRYGKKPSGETKAKKPATKTAKKKKA